MREDKAYAACFLNSSAGHAVHRNEAAKDIRPGACGYFDPDGKWVTVVQTILLNLDSPDAHRNETTGVLRAQMPPPKTPEGAFTPVGEETGETVDDEEADSAVDKDAAVADEPPADQGENGSNLTDDTGQQRDKSSQANVDNADQAPPDNKPSSQGREPDLSALVDKTEAMDITKNVSLDIAHSLLETVRPKVATSRTEDATPVANDIYSHLEGVTQTIKRDQEAWGVVQGGSLSLTEYKAEASAAIPHTPAQIKSWVTYGFQTRCGAILATDGLVTYRDAQPIDVLEGWVEKNLGNIMKTPHGPTIKRKGLWIVTKTYTSMKKAVAVMQSKGSSATLGVDVNIPHIAKVGPSIKWWETTVDKPGWKAHVDEEGLVLFMSGLYWKPSKLTRKMYVKREKERQDFLGGADGIDVEVEADQETEYYCFQPSIIGMVEGTEKLPKANYFDETDDDDQS